MEMSWVTIFVLLYIARMNNPKTRYAALGLLAPFIPFFPSHLTINKRMEVAIWNCTKNRDGV